MSATTLVAVRHRASQRLGRAERLQLSRHSTSDVGQPNPLKSSHPVGTRRRAAAAPRAVPIRARPLPPATKQPAKKAAPLPASPRPGAAAAAVAIAGEAVAAAAAAGAAGRAAPWKERQARGDKHVEQPHQDNTQVAEEGGVGDEQLRHNQLSPGGKLRVECNRQGQGGSQRISWVAGRDMEQELGGRVGWHEVVLRQQGS